MSSNFPYFDIVIFGLVAVFLVLRLRSILGTRTGLEKPRDPFAPPQDTPPGAQPDPQAGNVINLHAARAAAPMRNEPELFAGHRQIRAAEPSFDANSFLAGARAAFELIVSAFAVGDTSALRPLLSPEVFGRFAEAIRARAEAKETLETRLVSIKDMTILSGEISGRTILITVRFVSDQINATRAADGQVVEGHADIVAEKIDSWTFSREIRASDPNWLLVATRSS